jgi:hypothetical protein
MYLSRQRDDTQERAWALSEHRTGWSCESSRLAELEVASSSRIGTDQVRSSSNGGRCVDVQSTDNARPDLLQMCQATVYSSFSFSGVYDVSAYAFGHAKLTTHDGCGQVELGRCEIEDTIARGPT